MTNETRAMARDRNIPRVHCWQCHLCLKLFDTRDFGSWETIYRHGLNHKRRGDCVDESIPSQSPRAEGGRP